jgi:hypothetical protein
MSKNEGRYNIAMRNIAAMHAMELTPARKVIHDKRKYIVLRLISVASDVCRLNWFWKMHKSTCRSVIII